MVVFGIDITDVKGLPRHNLMRKYGAVNLKETSIETRRI